MKKILNDDDFITILEDKRGVHRIRKMEKMTARRCGGSKYDTDTRSCWKQRRQKYLYADTILSCPDVKVAAALCKGGPIHYQFRVDSGISGLDIDLCCFCNSLKILSTIFFGAW